MLPLLLSSSTIFMQTPFLILQTTCLPSSHGLAILPTSLKVCPDERSWSADMFVNREIWRANSQIAWVPIERNHQGGAC